MFRSVLRVSCKHHNRATSNTTQTLIRSTLIQLQPTTSITAISSSSLSSRSFATNPAVVSPTNTTNTTSSSSSSSVTVVSSSPVPGNLRTLKRDLVRILNEDSADLAVTPDKGLLQYLKELKMKITADKDGVVKIMRTVGDYNITFTFNNEAEPEEEDEETETNNAETEIEKPEEEGEREGEGEEGEEGESEESEEPRINLPSHPFEVDIKQTSATENNWLKIQALATKEGAVAIHSFSVDPSDSLDTTSLSSAPLLDNLPDPDRSRIFFDDLSPAGQDKLMEFLATIGIDDKMGQFVQHYAQVVRTQQYVDKIKQFQSFLNH